MVARQGLPSKGRYRHYARRFWRLSTTIPKLDPALLPLTFFQALTSTPTSPLFFAGFFCCVDHAFVKLLQKLFATTKPTNIPPQVLVPKRYKQMIFDMTHQRPLLDTRSAPTGSFHNPRQAQWGAYSKNATTTPPCSMPT